MCKTCAKYAINSYFSWPAWKRGAWSALWMTHLIDDHLILHGESTVPTIDLRELPEYAE